MVACRFCNADSASYTCPRCGVTYCSLKCYKCQEHLACSEVFYQEWVATERNSSFSASQRNDFLEILKRRVDDPDSIDDSEFLDTGDTSDSDEDAGCAGIHERMAGLDLDRDGNKVWERLSIEERREFERILESQEIMNLVPKWKPWWKNAVSSKISECGKTNDAMEKLSAFKTLVSSKSVALQNDICAVLFAYCLLCRYFNGDYEKICDEFVRRLLCIAPCFDGKEHHPATSSTIAVTQVFQRVSSINADDDLAKIFDISFACKVCRDVGIIVKSPRKEVICEAFADLLSIFDRGIALMKVTCSGNTDKAGKLVDKKNALLAKKKVQYFAGWITCVDESVFQQCSESLVALARDWQVDSLRFEQLKEDIERSGVMAHKEQDTVKIQEIS